MATAIKPMAWIPAVDKPSDVYTLIYGKWDYRVAQEYPPDNVSTDEPPWLLVGTGEIDPKDNKRKGIVGRFPSKGHACMAAEKHAQLVWRQAHDKGKKEPSAVKQPWWHRAIRGNQ